MPIADCRLPVCLASRWSNYASPDSSNLESLIANRQYKELMEFTSVDQTFVSVALNAGLRRARQGFGAMRDQHVPLLVTFGVIAAAAAISIILVLLIRPRATESNIGRDA